MCKGYQRISTAKERNDFLKNAKNSKSHQKITISKVDDSIKDNIKNLTGKDVKRIVLDTSSVKHSLKKNEHHITESDFKKIPRIINKNSSVQVEARLHQNNCVVHFTENKENGLHILMEVRGGKGDLALVTMYRPKKTK